MRLIYFVDGRVLGCFMRNRNIKNNGENLKILQERKYDDDDGGYLMILLEKSGGCYTCIDEYGEITKRLTKYVGKELLHLMRVMIGFRNAHNDVPYVNERLHSEWEEFPMRCRSVRWSDDDEYLNVLENGDIVVKSIGGSCEIKLHHSFEKARVSFYTPLSCNEKDKRYVKLTRWIYCDEEESRYDIAIRIAKSKGRKILNNAYVSKDVARCPPDADEPSWSDHDDLLCLSADPLKCFSAKNKVIYEWKPEANFRIQGQGKRVIAEVEADKSKVFVDVGKSVFFKHMFLNGEERIYSEFTIPRVVRCSNKDYELEDIATHTLNMLRNNLKLDSLKLPKSNNESPTTNQKTKQIVNEQVVPKVGRFTGYSDKSVRVLFIDRTMLYMDELHVKCNLIFPDGNTLTVNVGKPVHAEKYVKIAKRFAEWTFKGPETAKDMLMTVKRAYMIQTMQLANRREQQQLQMIMNENKFLLMQ